MPEHIYFVTGNEQKAMEVQAIFGKFPALDANARLFRVDLDIPEIQGNSQAIAIDKAEKAFKIMKKPVVVEDVSLGIDYLHGMPGPYIKDFLRTMGNDGIWKMVSPLPDHSATATCTVALKSSAFERPITFIGTIKGSIVAPVVKKGLHFGWDPIFKESTHDMTFYEMAPEMKNSISHRNIAFTKLADFLEQNCGPWGLT